MIGKYNRLQRREKEDISRSGEVDEELRGDQRYSQYLYLQEG
jgi:hypothetical protein